MSYDDTRPLDFGLICVLIVMRLLSSRPRIKIISSKALSRACNDDFYPQIFPRRLLRHLWLCVERMLLYDNVVKTSRSASIEAYSPRRCHPTLSTPPRSISRTHKDAQATFHEKSVRKVWFEERARRILRLNQVHEDDIGTDSITEQQSRAELREKAKMFFYLLIRDEYGGKRYEKSIPKR